MLIVFAIFQDYLFSRLYDTGFYISESLLYNTLWVFAIAIIWLEVYAYRKLKIQVTLPKILAVLTSSIVLSLAQITVSTLFFIAISNLVFTPAHRFGTIFNAYLSNQFFFLMVIYATVPLIEKAVTYSVKSTHKTLKYPDRIQVKTGTKTVQVKTSTISHITTNKPHSIIFTDDTTYFDDRSLKAFEQLLHPDNFIRVHRSVIINIEHVEEISSRQNGDYDALLSDGNTVRLSRHYRNSWKQLLH